MPGMCPCLPVASQAARKSDEEGQIFSPRPCASPPRFLNDSSSLSPRGQLAGQITSITACRPAHPSPPPPSPASPASPGTPSGTTRYSWDGSSQLYLALKVPNQYPFPTNYTETDRGGTPGVSCVSGPGVACSTGTSVDRTRPSNTYQCLPRVREEKGRGLPATQQP